ncbi:MAG TPA: DUF3488 domain-containing protein, partial [Acidimicrobiia bacterium]|nr:DUF3488 domain-containing protein [Acidimicrobiia bacterium]
SGGSGYGSVGGGIAFNRLVDLRQRILSPSNQVLFRATLGEGAPPASQIYWRMETLDIFDGTAWRPSFGSLRNYEPGQALGDPLNTYRGTTIEVLQLIRFEALRSELVPVAGIASEIQPIPDGMRPSVFKVASNAALIYPAGLSTGDTIQVKSTLPLYEADLGALASGPDGKLTPLFAAAADAGLFTATPVPFTDTSIPTPDLDFYTQLPDDLPSAIFAVARQRTEGATTDFERAWMLQYWFRDSGDFTYSTNVSTGNGALRLAKWLSDPQSRNYRTGYCEQFAASMAVLGRALGIPTRVVWGFTPGTVIEQNGVEVIEVRDTNAHAWVEMWMEGAGWVRFDPTPRSDFLPESITAGFDPAQFVSGVEPGRALREPRPATPGRDFGDRLDDPLTDPTDSGSAPWGLFAGVLALAPLAIPALKRLRRRWRLRRIRRGDITPVWDEIVDRLLDLGEPVPTSVTPLELAGHADSMLIPLAIRYSAVVYGGRSGGAGANDLQIVEEWTRLRYRRPQRFRAALNPRSLLRRR